MFFYILVVRRLREIFHEVHSRGLVNSTKTLHLLLSHIRFRLPEILFEVVNVHRVRICLIREVFTLYL